MNWSAAYVGIPFEDHGRDRSGCDCYGLARLVYLGELGIDLPEYGLYASADEHAEIAALIDGAAAGPEWSPCDGGRSFDLAVFRRGRLATHLGLVVLPGIMLHMADEDAAKVERIAGPWSSRLVGYWRHAGASA